MNLTSSSHRVLPHWVTSWCHRRPCTRRNESFSGREGLTFTFNFRGYLVLIFPTCTTIESARFCLTHLSIHTPPQGNTYIIFNNKKLFCHRPCTGHDSCTIIHLSKNLVLGIRSSPNTKGFIQLSIQLNGIRERSGARAYRNRKFACLDGCHP